jgi:WD40 repeat protein/uncharacterized caspase-like protein
MDGIEMFLTCTIFSLNIKLARRALEACVSDLLFGTALLSLSASGHALASSQRAPELQTVAPDSNGPAVSRPELFVRSTDFGLYPQLAVSPNGKWYAVRSGTHISIVSTQDGFEYRNFATRGTNSFSASIAISPDNNTIALPTGLNSDVKSHIMRVDVESARELPDVVVADGNSVTVVAYHPREDILAAVLANGAVYVVRASTSEVLFQGKIFEAQGLEKLHFSPDGSLLLAANESEIRLWNWRAKKELWSGDAHKLHTDNLSRILSFPDFFDSNKVKDHTAESLAFFRIVDAVFSPDAKIVAILQQDEVNLLHAGDGIKFASFPLDPLKTGEPRSLLFLDNNRIFTGLLSTAFIFDLPSKKVVEYPSATNAQVLAIQHSNNLIFNYDGRVAIRGIQPGPPVSYVQSKLASPLGDAGFSPDGLDLIAGVNGQMNLSDWKLETGELDTNSIIGDDPQIFAQSRDGHYVAFYRAKGFPNDTLQIWDRRQSREIKELSIELAGNNGSIAFSPDGKWLACISGSHKNLHLWSLPDFIPVQLPHPPIFAEGYGNDGNLVFSEQGDLLAVSAQNNVDVYALKQRVTLIQEIPIHKEMYSFLFMGTAHTAEQDNSFVSQVSFSPDGKYLVALASLNGHIFDTTTWTETGTIPNTSFACLSFSPGSHKVAAVTSHGAEPVDSRAPNISRLTLWDIDANKPVFATDAAGCPISFMPTGKMLAAGVPGGLGLFSSDDGKLLVNLYRFKKGGRATDDDAPDWLAVTPDGLFDGTSSAWSSLGWRFDGKTFDVSPIELFFRDFFKPGLLADIVAGNPPKAPVDLAVIDRRQPEVALNANPAGDLSSGSAHLVINAKESRVPANGLSAGSGIRDLRLFRNGTLVKIWRGDLALDADGAIRREADLPITSGENRFTAYAFNRGNIKSRDASLAVTGPPTLDRKGTAYVLAIGINQYEASKRGPSLNLNYAEADATQFASTFAAHQQELGEFGEVKTLRLLSASATRVNILAALAVLGGASESALTPEQAAQFANLKNVRPEDGVFLFYAGHGVADNGHFYLLPSDFSPDARLGEPASRAISELDLSQALEGISPARSFLIIDACNSGQAFDTGLSPVGPMNSTGLAQLAYEKGLYILAASQAMESALEASALAGGHGYLTYSLLEGLTTSAAAQDGVVTLRPWLEFATHRVPILEAQLTADSNSIGPVAALPGGNGRGVKRPNQAQSAPTARQHPRVFYRREPDSRPLVVARPEAGHP